MLRKRLARRGLALSAAWFAASLSEGTASAVSTVLLQETVRGAMMFSLGKLPAGVVSAAAIASVEEFLQGVFFSKCKYYLAAILLAGRAGRRGGTVGSAKRLTMFLEKACGSSRRKIPSRRKSRQSTIVWTSRCRREPLRAWEPCDSVTATASLILPSAADGKSIVSATGKNVHIWELATGKERVRLELDVPTKSVACSSDGKLIAVGCEDGTIRLWDPAENREVRRRGSPIKRDTAAPEISGVTNVQADAGRPEDRICGCRSEDTNLGRRQR